ncbi:MAG: hypothetical protein ACJ74H_02775 [Thermoanaerobaculia bacterium]
MFNRRRFLTGSGLAILAARGGLSHAQITQSAASPAPAQSAGERLAAALLKNRLPLTLEDGHPGGPGWNFLLNETREAHYTLIGEEHGVAETAQLSAALYKALRPSGYSRLAVELSPAIAADIELTLRRDGIRGIERFLAMPGTWGVLYSLREESAFLADVVAATPGSSVLWGLDYEIFADRYLISKLLRKAPVSAKEPLSRLQNASNAAWEKQVPFSVSGADPALVKSVRAAWAKPDSESDAILRTLEETLAINGTRGRLLSLQRRVAFTRGNFAQYLREEKRRGKTPKVMFKFGYNHMIRGANFLNVFDLGSLPDEIAAMEGGRAFHILVLPGTGSRQVTLGPKGWVPVSTDEYDEFNAGEKRLGRVLPRSDAAGHEVIDLRPIRPLVARGFEEINPDLVRTIHGYDAAVIWKGAHAATPIVR